jgi:hypothetical protein
MHIRERSSRVGEEHDAEPRKRQIEAASDKGVGGDIGAEHLGVPYPGGGDAFARPRHRWQRNVGAEHMPVRPDARRQLQDRRTAAAADVEHVLAGLRRGQIQSRRCQPGERTILPFVLFGPGPCGGAVPVCRLGVSG